MSVSKDTIRSFCKENYINPARSRGDSHITIRIAEVARAFGLEPDSHVICDAVWSTEFEMENNLFRVSNSCLRNSKVSNMVFRLLPE